jgi:hypothetical protein
MGDLEATAGSLRASDLACRSNEPTLSPRSVWRSYGVYHLSRLGHVEDTPAKIYMLSLRAFMIAPASHVAILPTSPT